LVERFVRFLVPPCEHRIVAVIERVPVAQVAAQAVDSNGGAIGDSLFYVCTAFDCAASFVNLFAQIIKSCGDFGGVDGFHTTSRFFECDDFVDEWDKRLDLADLA
jgi:hypothetical protein